MSTSAEECAVQQTVSVFQGDLKGKTFAVWDFPFKPNTDDAKPVAACSWNHFNGRQRSGAFDPEAMEETQRIYSKDEPLVLCWNERAGTERRGCSDHLRRMEKEFRSPDFDGIKAAPKPRPFSTAGICMIRTV